MMRKHWLRSTTVLAAAVLAVAGCRGSSDAGSASGDSSPIVLGSVNTKSGPATFPEASQAATAVFDRVNKEGGIGGRRIRYLSLDDKGDPATASSSARQIVSSDNAVLMAGSASLIECDINAAYYAQNKIMSMPGVGVDTGCFDKPGISPANVGPFNDLTLTLLYGSEVLKLDRICVLLELAGNTKPSYEAAIARWSQITGKKPTQVDDTVPYGASDYTPYIVKAKAAGCNALTGNPVEPDAIGWNKAANAQGWTDVTYLLLTSAYSENFAKSVAQAGKGIYIPAEFYPFTNQDSSINQDWLNLMKSNNIQLTSFSQGGYLAATYAVQVLKGISGPVTRESVTKALQELKPIVNPMVGTPYTFGTASTHHDNIAGWPVKLLSGSNKWVNAADDWLRIPSSRQSLQCPGAPRVRACTRAPAVQTHSAKEFGMLQGALSGLAAGGLYAVLAVCLTLMAQLVRVVNFAQAATGMFGGFCAVWLVSTLAWPIWLASIAGVLIGGLLSALIGFIIATWLPEADITTRSAVTVAALLLLISMSFILFGNKPQPFAPIIAGPAFEVSGVVISQLALVTVAAAIGLALACHVVLTRTSVGLRLRALSERPTTAELIGIPARPYAAAVWVVTGLIGATIIVVVAPSQSNDATSLAMLIVPAAAAALMGGFRRLDLSVVGGLLLGVLSGLFAQIDGLSYVRAFLPFIFILAFLLWMQRKEVWDVAR